MVEYIERERLKETFNADLQTLQSLDEHTMNLIFMEIDEAPAADVAPVIHAEWGKYESFPLTPSLNGYPCSNCGMHFSASSVPILKFCPNCGARMDL